MPCGPSSSFPAAPRRRSDNPPTRAALACVEIDITLIKEQLSKQIEPVAPDSRGTAAFAYEIKSDEGDEGDASSSNQAGWLLRWLRRIAVSAGVVAAPNDVILRGLQAGNRSGFV